ncbi:MAG: hypothetical protein LBR93_11735, partial [Treponema sp.]|nr:hypothetical protein [Treponema sp.]
MKRKSLLFGLLAVLSAVLIFTGCANPADGSNGSPGKPGDPGDPGGIFIDGTVTAGDLENAFLDNNLVILQSGVDSVEGLVPQGKILRMGGTATEVEDGKELKVDGTLEITPKANLTATGVSTGVLKGTGSVTGDGILSLPVIVDDGSFDGLHYLSDNITVTKKAAGATVTGGTATDLSDGDGVAGIFAVEGINDLSVSGITGIATATIPANKTLRLQGDGNKLAATATFAPAGAVIVEDGGELATTKADGTTVSKITIAGGGKLDLAKADDKVSSNVTNNGTFATVITDDTEFKKLLALSGSGKIESGGRVEPGSYLPGA